MLSGQFTQGSKYQHWPLQSSDIIIVKVKKTESHICLFFAQFCMYERNPQNMFVLCSLPSMALLRAEQSDSLCVGSNCWPTGQFQGSEYASRLNASYTETQRETHTHKHTHRSFVNTTQLNPCSAEHSPALHFLNSPKATKYSLTFWAPANETQLFGQYKL